MIAGKAKTRTKTAAHQVVKIGGVKVTILSHPGKGKISTRRLQDAVAEVMAKRTKRMLPRPKSA